MAGCFWPSDELKFRNGGGDKRFHARQRGVFLAGPADGQAANIRPTVQFAGLQQVSGGPPHARVMVTGHLVIRHKPVNVDAAHLFTFAFGKRLL